MQNRIKALRKELGLNQEDFGKKLGVTKSSISSMESGRFSVTDSMVKLICSEFNVNERWLRGDDNESMFIGPTTTDMLYGVAMARNNDFQMKLLNLILQLDDKELDFLENIIEKLQKK